MTKQLSNRLFAVTFAAGMMLASSTLFAQVKIGGNSDAIGANSNIEIEATNANKVVVTKDAGKLVVDGAAQVKTLPAAALTDKTVAADANGNLTVRTNLTIAPVELLTGSPIYYTSDQLLIAVNAVRTGNVVCLEGNIFAKQTVLPNANLNEFIIALIPAGYRPRVQFQGPNGGNLGPHHADAWEVYSPNIYTNGAVGFYLPDAEFTVGRNVSLNGVCYIVN